ncbi:MAG: group 1 truncated hemoglobin [Proteobacteria bacterium]|nr:MAG: group 1 truncated hemoglobin [Pseudomonadota bacterium]
MQSKSGQDSLYRRLGGYDAIAAIIADLFQLLGEDERFRRFGPGRGLDSKARAQQLTVELICALAGGPCVYLGRDMKTSHHGLGITVEEWEANLALAARVLQKHGVAAQETQEFLGLFERFRADIVELPPKTA